MLRKEFIDLVTATGLATLKEVRRFGLSKDDSHVSELELLQLAKFDEVSVQCS